MKVVTKSEASRIAGVSRQAIQDLKRINSLNKKKYPFFVFDPESGKPGVDIEHKEWQKYLDRNESKRVKKKRKLNNTKGQVNQSQSKDYVLKDHFARAVVGAIKEQYGSNGAELKKLLSNISKRYEGMM